MIWVYYITLLLLATAVSADYYIDNANTSVQYAMAPSQSGQGWQTFSVSTQQLALKISNSTGNYTITLDASNCYDQNYALGVCGSGDSCFVQIPFVGSGITMYVFNAGASGMTASFSVDDGQAVTNTIQAPPPPTYQVSNVSIYDIQGLSTGLHNMTMTVLDWEGSATSMKFDYAYVNESFVAAPATISSTLVTTSTASFQSQTPTQTSAGITSTSKKINLGAVIGGTLGGVVVVAALGLFFWRKRPKATREGVYASESPDQVSPFMSEYHGSPSATDAPSSSPTPHQYQSQGTTFFTQHPETRAFVNPLQRSTMLRDALAAGTLHPSPEPIYRSQSTVSITSSSGVPPLVPLRRQPSHSGDGSTDAVRLSAVADAGSPFIDSQMISSSRRDHPALTATQREVIDRLRVDKVPAETIARVVEGFVSSGQPYRSGADLSSGRASSGSMLSALPPPSYQTEDR